MEELDRGLEEFYRFFQRVALPDEDIPLGIATDQKGQAFQMDQTTNRVPIGAFQDGLFVVPLHLQALLLLIVLEVQVERVLSRLDLAEVDVALAVPNIYV